MLLVEQYYSNIKSLKYGNGFHHHAKHAPGWNLQQPQSGIMRWTTPSGRTYTTHPTQYDD